MGIDDLLEQKKRYLFGKDIDRHVGKYTCVSEITTGYEEINEPVVPVRLKEKDKRKIKNAIETYERIEARKAESKRLALEKKAKPKTPKPPKLKPVMCVETGQVFNNPTEAWIWHGEKTGYRSDIARCLRAGSATRAGYHFIYV